jgi:hypothetical protein
MRAHHAVLSPQVPRRIYRHHCEKCAEERLFQAYKCLTCSTVRAAPLKPVDGYRPSKGKVARQLKFKGYRQQAFRDRVTAARARAEASRQKFEGKADANASLPPGAA